MSTPITKAGVFRILMLAFWALHLRSPGVSTKSLHQGKSTYPNEGLISERVFIASPQLRRFEAEKKKCYNATLWYHLIYL
jgi:hypothetical protein